METVSNGITKSSGGLMNLWRNNLRNEQSLLKEPEHQYLHCYRVAVQCFGIGVKV